MIFKIGYTDEDNLILEHFEVEADEWGTVSFKAHNVLSDMKIKDGVFRTMVSITKNGLSGGIVHIDLNRAE